jgi:hypothetical protein
VTQCGSRLASCPPFTLEQGVEIERDSSLQHVIDRPGELMHQDREGFALAVVFLSAGERLLARRIVAEAQERRFGEGLLEVRLPDPRAGGARMLACRLHRPFAQAARGHDILPAREAGHIRHCIQEHATEALANARDGLQQGQRIGSMLLGGLPNG